MDLWTGLANVKQSWQILSLKNAKWVNVTPQKNQYFWKVVWKTLDTRVRIRTQYSLWPTIKPRLNWPSTLLIIPESNIYTYSFTKIASWSLTACSNWYINSQKILLPMDSPNHLLCRNTNSSSRCSDWRKISLVELADFELNGECWYSASLRCLFCTRKYSSCTNTIYSHCHHLILDYCWSYPHLAIA